MKTILKNSKKISAILVASAIIFCNINAQSSNSVQNGTMVTFLKEQKTNSLDEKLTALTNVIEKKIRFQAPSASETEEAVPYLLKYESTSEKMAISHKKDKKSKKAKTESFNSSMSNVDAFRDWLGTNLNDELAEVNKSVDGKVIVSFIVDETGNVSNVKVESSSNKEIDNIIVDLVKKSPEWRVTVKNNKPVKQKFTLPISYKVKK